MNILVIGDRKSDKHVAFCKYAKELDCAVSTDVSDYPQDIMAADAFVLIHPLASPQHLSQRMAEIGYAAGSGTYTAVLLGAYEKAPVGMDQFAYVCDGIEDLMDAFRKWVVTTRMVRA